MALRLVDGRLVDVALFFEFVDLVRFAQSDADGLVADEEHDEAEYNQREDVFIEQIAFYSCPYFGPFRRFLHDFFRIRVQKYKYFWKCANIFVSLRDKSVVMRRNCLYLLVLSCMLSVFVRGQQHVNISDVEHWTVADLKQYVGQTVVFDVPFYICSTASGNMYVGPRRLFTPTNQVTPGSLEYRNLLTLNNNGTIRLDNYQSSYPETQIRTGVKVYNLKAKVYADYLEMESGEWRGNLRKDLEKEIPNVDMVGEHTLLICGMNLDSS